ncbi:DUF262 domain-containing protein [Paenibacillus silviterrae]|uniref:DUF262 domain-containing protein n=1 Tax=Paenibacillus silviterrae TaxID=3242194 RepID=UPI002542D6BB|nr:DUF262 domain-containing protein [Paenibacillus chinjuensis]
MSKDLSSILEDRATSVSTLSFDISVGELLSIYQDDELIINPDFQRLFRWPTDKQSRLIESILLEFPIPPVYVIERDDGVYELIDGLQRITTLLRFFGLQTPYLTLEDCELVPELNGMTVEELPLSLRLKLKRFPIRLNVVRKNSTPSVRFEIFRRLNTGGELLEPQEIRNAIIRIIDSRYCEFIIFCSTFASFQTCVSSVSEEKLQKRYDQELVLRFFALKNKRDSFRHDVEGFLTDYMREVSENKLPFEYDEEQKIFEKTFNLLKEIDGDTIFCSRKGDKIMNRFIISMYEAFVISIQKYLGTWDDDMTKWDESRLEKYRHVFSNLFTDLDFKDYLGSGSNTPAKLNGRIDYVERKLEGL